jgi:sugar phosphate isomerase/epimerase
MDRRSFIGQSAALLAVAHDAWGEGESLPFTALGACADLDRAAGIRAAGGGYIEWKVARGLIPEQPESVWQKHLEQARSCPLPIQACNSFLPGSHRSTGPDADPDKVLQYAETAFRRAGEIGVEIIVFGSSGSRKLPEGFPREQAVEQFCGLLSKMGPMARQHGITVVIEPLRRKEDNFINTVVQGAEIAERVNHPNIRLLADFYHMLQNGEDPNDIQKVGHLLKHCHIAEKEQRTAPGVKGDDFRPFFAALKSVGYKGRLSIEGKWTLDQLPTAYDVIRRQATEA